MRQTLFLNLAAALLLPQGKTFPDLVTNSNCEHFLVQQTAVYYNVYILYIAVYIYIDQYIYQRILSVKCKHVEGIRRKRNAFAPWLQEYLQNRHQQLSKSSAAIHWRHRSSPSPERACDINISTWCVRTTCKDLVAGRTRHFNLPVSIRVRVQPPLRKCNVRLRRLYHSHHVTPPHRRKKP